MKSNVYIISSLVVLTIQTVSQSMHGPGKEKKSYAIQKTRIANDNALLEASRKGDIARIISLLESGSNIDTTDAKGRQPLYFAACNGHTATVELLLDREATGIDAPDNNGWQPIHLAAQDGHTDTAELLLDRGATGIDVPDKHGKQPLHWAAWNGRTGTVELLLDRGATGIDAPDKDGRQPLHCAAGNGHTGIMVTLILHGATIPDTMPLHRTLADVFAQSDFTSIPPIPFGRYLEETPTVSDVFSMGAGQNKQETVQTVFTKHRTNLTESNIIDALIGSATAGHGAMVRMLHNEMSNERNLRPLVAETLARALSRAVAHRRVDVIRYVIQQDSTYDTPTFSLLRAAGTLLRRILSPYTAAKIRASERLSDNISILTMLSERQCWRYHTLPLIGHAQAASVDREETLPQGLSPIIRIPTELWLIILNYLADRHLYDITK